MPLTATQQPDGRIMAPARKKKAVRPPKPRHNLIVVEHTFGLSRRLERLLGDEQFEVYRESDLDHVVERFEHVQFDILLITSAAFRSGEIEGVELLEVIAARSPATQVLFIAAPGDIRYAMAALEAGTYQYAVEPVSDEELRLLVKAALANRPDFATARTADDDKLLRFEQLCGGSAPMQELYQLIQQAASSDIPVLITGETGTGKDLVAQAIHNRSAAASGPYVPVHLGALPNELVDAELFGHEKGAFTGAVARRAGHFERARNGTVFLDEIGLVEEKIQISLLRVIEEQRFMRLGGKRWLRTNARIVAATNEDLSEAVTAGRFREDLYYRLDVFRIPVPPLRQRPGDLASLVREFMLRFNREFRKHVEGGSPECIRLLESYHWPGNVRELKNTIQRAVLVCAGKTLLPEHLPPRIRKPGHEMPTVTVRVGTPLREVERLLVLRALSVARSRQEAAEMLGVSRKTLYNKMQRFGIPIG